MNTKRFEEARDKWLRSCDKLEHAERVVQAADERFKRFLNITEVGMAVARLETAEQQEWSCFCEYMGFDEKRTVPYFATSGISHSAKRYGEITRKLRSTDYTEMCA